MCVWVCVLRVRATELLFIRLTFFLNDFFFGFSCSFCQFIFGLNRF